MDEDGGRGGVVEGEDGDDVVAVDLEGGAEGGELRVLCKDGGGKVCHHQIEEQQGGGAISPRPINGSALDPDPTRTRPD